MFWSFGYIGFWQKADYHLQCKLVPGGVRIVALSISSHEQTRQKSLLFSNRAYPDSEFVEANTLAKCNKLEPNEIHFSQDFSLKLFCI